MTRLIPILLVLFASFSAAYAHRIDSVSIAADFRTDGSYTVTLSVEPARLPVDPDSPIPPLPPENTAPVDPAERQAIFDLAKPFFLSNFSFFFDADTISPELSFDFAEVAEKDAVAEGVAFRDGQTHLFLVATFSGTIPADVEGFRFTVSRDLPMAVIFVGSVDGEHKGRAQALFAGEESKPYPLAWSRPQGDPSAAEVPDSPRDPFLKRASRYLVVGFEHILPDGLDHIFFVLGLFFLSVRLVPLLWQVTAFTLAHTITLALAYLDIVRVPSHIVEPLIALSIAVVAIENIFTKRLRPHRVAVVFAFGLLHGLGFAGAFAELHLPKEEFIEGLIFLNIGVEVGQLAVIAIVLAHFFLGRLLLKKSDPAIPVDPAYRSFVAIPASIFIAAVGLVATVDRVWPDSIPSFLSFLQIL